MDGNNRVFSLLNLIYPVGSIFMTVNNTNPGSYIENTVWEPWGQGRVVIGVDSNDADFNKALITGGEKKHTLTVAEMPAHGHYYTPNRQFVPKSNGAASVQGGNSYADIVRSSGGMSGTDETGDNQPHNNLPPYITCYMWRRTE